MTAHPCRPGESSGALCVFSKCFCEKMGIKVPTRASRKDFSLSSGNKSLVLTVLLSGSLVTEGAENSGRHWGRSQKENILQDQEASPQRGEDAVSRILRGGGLALAVTSFSVGSEVSERTAQLKGAVARTSSNIWRMGNLAKPKSKAFIKQMMLPGGFPLGALLKALFSAMDFSIWR